ncbi:MAG: hydroxymethylpyrimidine ABC transporter substrate-binding protein, partial [Gammaproteobacteria bacterium]|nr:hydroxymethylpyrimidine ABC transporter substrate-binding protein [Gammaproteobacteria bacterium]
PTATHLLEEGARRLYDSRQMPDTIFDVLAIKPEVAERQPEALAALVASHFRALRHFRHNPQDAAYRMAARMGIPAEEVLDAFRGLELPGLHANRRLLDGSTNRLLAAAGEISQVMVAAGLLRGATNLNGLVIADFLPEVD